MADEQLLSTIATPTPETSGEILDLTHDLGLLTRHKNTLTTGGQLARGLRRVSESANLVTDNPFILGAEGIWLLRQLVAHDGILLREFLRKVLDTSTATFTRDDLSQVFAELVNAAVQAARDKVPRAALQEAIRFRKLIEETTKKFGKSDKNRGPGVLEHRVAPRLEWLVDLGCLSKNGLQKNSFSYRTCDMTQRLLVELNEHADSPHCAEQVAIAQWFSNPRWALQRRTLGVSSRRDSILRAYALLRRPIGPSPLREVAFASVIFRKTPSSYEDTRNEAIEMARTTSGASLSGGRYTREPENIYLPDSALSHLHQQ
ncbi:MAG: hypothetical protein GKR94_20975 [Gammaproteobacteria bacterium]|nr:hypothetical protein [Gammaproteobacteria bacterium]